MTTKVTPSDTPAEAPNVHVAIARVAADIGHIAKAQQVQAGPAKFSFRGIDDVLNAIHGPLADHGVSVVPCGFDLHDQSERVTKSGGALVHLLATVHYRIIGPAGDFVEAAALAEALDTSDKAASKAMSMAFKYVCFQVFSIPVRGALEESDREQLERGGYAPGFDADAYEADVRAAMDTDDKDVLRALWQRVGQSPLPAPVRTALLAEITEKAK
jgi:hypothetical protein